MGLVVGERGGIVGERIFVIWIVGGFNFYSMEYNIRLVRGFNEGGNVYFYLFSNLFCLG